MAEPFLTYVTVFKSRLAVNNLVLAATGFGHQPPEAVLRKIRKAVDERRPLQIDDAANACVLEYLLGKKILGSTSRSKGRYRGLKIERGADGMWLVSRGSEPLTEMSAFLTDLWMSDSRLASTIGAPTPDNVHEILELSYQLRLLSKAKNAWTAAGHLSQQLRNLAIEDEGAEENPFVLRMEATCLFRQVIEVDGILLREVIREIVSMGGIITRNQVQERFTDVVDRAVAVTKIQKVAAPNLRKARDFADLIRKTAQKQGSSTRGPGVLEHRVAPRLEWLTDLGYLSKSGRPKNGFEYSVNPSCADLLEELDSRFGEKNWSDSVAIWDWRTHPRWNDTRSLVAVLGVDGSFRRAYHLMRRSIGPAPLREVAFLASLLSESAVPFSETLERLIRYANDTPGASLTGGQYSRAPANIYLPDPALERT